VAEVLSAVGQQVQQAAMVLAMALAMAAV